MIYKTISDPRYTVYHRRDRKGNRITTEGIDELLIPLLLRSKGPLVDLVNDMEICDLTEDNGMNYNEERTRREKAELKRCCPKIRFQNSGLVVKVSQNGTLAYEKVIEPGIINPRSAREYIQGRTATVEYIAIQGIFARKNKETPTAYSKRIRSMLLFHEKKRSLNFFSGDRLPKDQSGEFNGAHMVFLLSEVNRLIERLRKK